MKNTYLIAFLVFLLPFQAAAQDVERLAKEYVALPDVVVMMDEMFSPAAIASQFEASIPAEIDLPDAKREKIGTIISKNLEIVRPRLESAMVEAMAANFSGAEVQALIDFYSSEHGGTVMRKMQPYMSQVMTLIAPAMEEMQKKMIPEIFEVVVGEE